MKSPLLAIGALIGGLLTACLTAVFYLSHQVAGLPFVPFDIFDWMVRVLPGPVITFGIDLMVSIINALGVGETSTVAKTAEQLQAIVGFLLAGAIAGVLLTLILRRRHEWGHRPGLVLGAVAAIPIAMISLAVSGPAVTSPVISVGWILVAMLVWGFALGSVLSNLITVSRSKGEAGDDLEVKRISRRKFILRVGAATAVITFVGAGLGTLIARRRHSATRIDPGALWSSNNPLPNEGAQVNPVAGTRPELTPLQDHYRIDINTTPPVIRKEDWRLKIGGLVDNPIELTLEELRSKYEPMHQFVTLSCISNPIGGSLISTTRWSGVSLQKLVADIRVKENGTHLRIRSADGFHEVVALETINADKRVMLAYDWDGVPLKPEHGYPLRVYIPDHYGMKQPKWIESIDVIDGWEEGYWVSRGWDRLARVRATSVIDSIGVDMMIAGADQNTVVPIGGIAYAGARGISRVEVRVDGGEWREAQLRASLSETTWVIWRYDWSFEPGKHTFAVRCIDGGGEHQIETDAPVHPSGATGLHSRSSMF